MQNDGLEHLARQVYDLKLMNSFLNNEVEKLSLDLGIRNQDGGPMWRVVPK